MVDRSSTIGFINQKYGVGRRASTITASHANPAMHLPISQHVERISVAPTTYGPPIVNPPSAIISQRRRVETVQPSYIQNDVMTTPIVESRTVTATQPRGTPTGCMGSKILGCPWWLCVLLTIIGLVGLIALLSACVSFYKGRGTWFGSHPTIVNGGTPQEGCAQGFFQFNGKCISCPMGSTWNGQNCIRTRQQAIPPTVSSGPMPPSCPLGQTWNGIQCVTCPPGMVWSGQMCVAAVPNVSNPPLMPHWTALNLKH